MKKTVKVYFEVECELTQCSLCSTAAPAPDETKLTATDRSFSSAYDSAVRDFVQGIEYPANWHTFHTGDGASRRGVYAYACPTCFARLQSEFAKAATPKVAPTPPPRPEPRATAAPRATDRDWERYAKDD